jgi:hypothetical protein
VDEDIEVKERVEEDKEGELGVDALVEEVVIEDEEDVDIEVGELIEEEEVVWVGALVEV